MRILILIISLVFHSYSFAESIFVSPSSGRGLDKETLETVTEIAKEAASQNTNHQLVSEKKNSDFSIKISVRKLGMTYIVSGLRKTKNEKVVFRNKLKSSNIEDLDLVTQRLVRGLLNLSSFDGSDAHVDEVSQDEVTRGTNRQKAIQQWSFGIGPAWSSNLKTPKASKSYSLGYSWIMDSNYDLGFNMDWFVPDGNDDARFLNLALGVTYMFTKNKNAPYVIGEFGYASAAASDGDLGDSLFSSLSSDDKASGYSLGLGIGYKFFRTSTTNLGLSLKYSHLFNKTAVSQKQPGITFFNIKIFW